MCVIVAGHSGISSSDVPAADGGHQERLQPLSCECCESLLQVLVTSNDFTDPEFKDNLCGTVEDLLSMNVVPVFNENDAISKGAARSKVRLSALLTKAAASLSAGGSTLVKHSFGSTTLRWILLGAACSKGLHPPANHAS